MAIYISYLIIATFISYFLVSMVQRDIVVSYSFRYRGIRAVILSLCCLVLSIIYVRSYLASYAWFNYVPFAWSFSVGLPAAWLLHKVSGQGAEQSHLLEHLSPHAISPRRFFFWGIAGFPAGALIAIFIYLMSGALALSIVCGLLFAGGITWLLARTHWTSHGDF